MSKQEASDVRPILVDPARFAMLVINQAHDAGVPVFASQMMLSIAYKALIDATAPDDRPYDLRGHFAKCAAQGAATYKPREMQLALEGLDELASRWWRETIAAATVKDERGGHYGGERQTKGPDWTRAETGYGVKALSRQLHRRYSGKSE